MSDDDKILTADALSDAIREQFGVTYSPALLDNPDWCVKEVARWGFGSTITFYPPGLVPDVIPADVRRMVNDAGGCYMAGLTLNWDEQADNAVYIGDALQDVTRHMVLRAASLQHPLGIKPRASHPKSPPPPSVTTWPGLAEEIAEHTGGRMRYRGAQLADPDWCLREIGRLGYSCTLTFTTADQVIARRRQNGVLNEDPQAQAMIDSLRILEGMFTYQLRGQQYKSRGAHGSPTMEHLSQATGVALFNVTRLLPDPDRYRVDHTPTT